MVGRTVRWRPDDPTGAAIGVAFASFLAALSVVRYRNHWATGLDLGLFDQAVWLLSEGRAPTSSLVGGNIFGDHMSVVLFAFAPLYRVAATPVWLLAAQAVALGATVVPLRRIGTFYSASPGLITALTVGSAPLLSAAVFDFHPVVLAVPAVAWMASGVLEDRLPVVLCAASWILVCRADAGFVALGLVLLARRRVIPWLLATAVLGSIASLAIPAVLGSGSRQEFERYYATLGDSPLDAAQHPWRIIDALGSGSAARTLFIWLLPVLFVPVLQLRWLLTLIVSGLPLLLSSWPGIAEPWYHNGALMAPLVLAGSAAVIAGRQAGSSAPIAALAGCALALAIASPLSPLAPPGVRVWTFARDNGSEVDRTLALVPDGVSVAAVDVLVPHLSRREAIYQLPCPIAALVAASENVAEVDVCGSRDLRPDVILARATDAAVLESLGYEVQASPTPGLVLAQR